MPSNVDGEILLDVGINSRNAKKAAADLGKNISQIFAATNGKKVDASFQKLLNNIKKLQEESRKVNGEIAKLETTKIPSDEYKKAAKSVEDLTRKVKMYQGTKAEYEKRGLTDSDTYRKTVEYIEKANQQLKEAVATKRELETSGNAFSFASENDLQQYQDLVNKSAELNNQMRMAVDSANERLGKMGESALSAMDERAKTFLQDIMTNMKKMLATVKRVTSAFVGFGAAIVKSGISKLAGWFTGADKSADSFHNKLKRGISTVVRYALGFASLGVLVNKLKSAATEAFQRMAQQIPEVNKDISTLKNSFQNLKNSIGTMFQPLLAALTPLITRIVNGLTQVIDKVAQFIAALTGQKYIYKATAANIDYAKSLDKTNKKIKEQQNQLGEYDKLQVIGKKDDGSGGYDADAAKGTYQKVPIDPKYLKWLEWLKDMWKNGDFFELGAKFAKWLEGLLDRIPWDKIKAFMGKLGKSLASFFNGIFANLRLAWKLGNAVAQAFNSLLTLGYEFVKEFKFKQFGKWIGSFISSALSNIDWDMLHDFAKRLGRGIADAIRGLTESNAIREIGNAIGHILRAAIDFAFELVTNFPFEELANEIIRGLKAFFARMSETDETNMNGWQKLGTAISTLVIKLLHSINEILGNEELRQSVGTAITQFLNSIDFNTLISELGTFISNLASLLVTVIQSALASENFRAALAQLAPYVLTALVAMFTVSTLTAAGQRIAIGLMRSIGTQLAAPGVLTAIAGDLLVACTFIASSIVTFFAGADIGKTIGKYMFPTEADVYDEYEGITGTIRMMKEFVEAMAYEMGEAWGLLKERTVEHITNLKDTLGPLWTSVENAGKTAVANLVNAATHGFSSLLTNAIDVINSIIFSLNLLGQTWSLVTGKVSEPVQVTQGVGVRHAPTTSSSTSRAVSNANSLINGSTVPANKNFVSTLNPPKSNNMSEMHNVFNEALNSGLSSNNQPIVLQLDGRTIASVMWDEQKKRYAQTGQYSPRMA